MPSTPAVRAPLLPRTRRHATKRNAGSVTRLNRSSNLRRGSSLAQQCSFVWISSTRRSASSKTGVSSSVFTGDLLAFQSIHRRLAVPLRHVRASRTLGLLRGLRHVAMPSVDDEPARRPAGCQEVRATSRRFPRSPHSVQQGSRPALPRQHRHTYAAGLQRGLPTSTLLPASESPPLRMAACTAPGPYPPDLSRHNDYGASITGSSRTASCHRLPNPHRLAVPARPGFVRAAPILPHVSAVGLPPASPACCDRPETEVFHPRSE